MWNQVDSCSVRVLQVGPLIAGALYENLQSFLGLVTHETRRTQLAMGKRRNLVRMEAEWNGGAALEGPKVMMPVRQ